MARFVKGDVVVVPFPFSDLTAAKRRPALVIASPHGSDPILCQITSQTIRDDYAIPLEDDHFNSGSLRRRSNVRPNRIFTADRRIILYKVGELKEQMTTQITEKLVDIITT